MDWRQMYSATVGAPPETPYVPPYVASLVFFIVNMAVGVGLRGLTKLMPLPCGLRDLALDFLCTMEACCYFFENNFVVKNYGFTWLAVVVIVQCYVCGRTFGDNIDNPVKAFHHWLRGQVPLPNAAVKIVVTNQAGLASYRLARLIWSLDLIEDHHKRFYEVTCGSDLQVTLVTGLLIEMTAMSSDTWLGMQTLTSSAALNEFLKYLNVAFMMVFGLHTTGMYFNPAMASGHTLGCGNTAYSEHFAVYWLGPFLGCFLATMLDHLLHVDHSVKFSVQRPSVRRSVKSTSVQKKKMRESNSRSKKTA